MRTNSITTEINHTISSIARSENLGENLKDIFNSEALESVFSTWTASDEYNEQPVSEIRTSAAQKHRAILSRIGDKALMLEVDSAIAEAGATAEHDGFITGLYLGMRGAPTPCLTEWQSEILRIFESLDVKKQTDLLTYAYELQDDQRMKLIAG